MATFVTIKVIPNSGKQQLSLDKSGIIKCHLKSPPEDGKANRELIAFLSKKLKVPQIDITIVQGLTSRKKTLKISGTLTQQNVMHILGYDGHQQLSLTAT